MSYCKRIASQLIIKNVLSRNLRRSKHVLTKPVSYILLVKRILPASNHFLIDYKNNQLLLF